MIPSQQLGMFMPTIYKHLLLAIFTDNDAKSTVGYVYAYGMFVVHFDSI